MNEHRRSRRKPAYLTIPVVNKMTGQTLGRIGNLSADGMLLVCEVPITQGALFQLGFELSNAQGNPHSIDIGVQEMWTENANVPGQYWAGFQFIDVSDRDLAAIESWLGENND
jgi:hypothetical protein